MRKESLNVPIVDRYKGCLLGVAAGDALGQPVEFIPLNGKDKALERFDEPWKRKIRKFIKEIQEKHGGVIREMLLNPFGYWEKGEYTDDTTQTLLLADSFIEKGKYDPDDFVSRLLKWYDNGKAKGIGRTTELSLGLINAGVADWKSVGKYVLKNFGKFFSNGSLMRTSPVGLYFREYIEDIDRVAAELSIITHAAEPAIVVCQMASQLVSQLVSGVPKNEAVDFIERNVYNSYSDYEKYPMNADSTFSVALISFANADSFEEAVVEAVNKGGDTDTCGSVAGALAGAYWGVAQIPERWAKCLKPQSAQQIGSKAEKLYLLNTSLRRS